MNGHVNGMERHQSCQSIYAPTGEVVFAGEWDPKAMLHTLGPESYWQGRSVLDIGSNTSGLSIEIARLGARVTAAEPDPRQTSKHLAINVIQHIIDTEHLDLTLTNTSVFDLDINEKFDAVLFLGLIYHFRHPQYVLDLISNIVGEHLFISCQTIPGDQLIMLNRADKKYDVRRLRNRNLILSGWQPTRALLEKMIELSGFGEVVPISDASLDFPNKPDGHTNNAYYRATKMKKINMASSLREFT